MESLKAFLNQKSAGEIKNSPDLPGLLAESWPEFTGHDSEGMRADKLGQMEEIKWYPPVLEFTLKQFGGTVKGAIRAEVQRWKLDIERKTASAKCMAYPEIVKNSAPFYVNSIADELARFIIQGERHPALVRSSGGLANLIRQDFA